MGKKIYEHRIVHRYMDKDNNMHINFPETRSDCVRVNNNTKLDDLLKNIAYCSAHIEDENGSFDENDDIKINADLLKGLSLEELLTYINNTDDREWIGKVIQQEYGGTGMSKYTPNSIIYSNSEGKLSLLEAPNEDSILVFKNKEFKWIPISEILNN